MQRIYYAFDPWNGLGILLRLWLVLFPVCSRKHDFSVCSKNKAAMQCAVANDLHSRKEKRKSNLAVKTLYCVFMFSLLKVRPICPTCSITKQRQCIRYFLLVWVASWGLEVVRMAGARSGVAGVRRVKLQVVTRPLALTVDPINRANKNRRKAGLGTGFWLPEENGRALPIERERDAGRRRRIGGRVETERHAAKVAYLPRAYLPR